MKKNDLTPYIREDRIDLRELFSVINQYKWSIIFFTLLITFSVTIKVYFMPKYYKSMIMLEVKPQDDKTGGFSMGGAAAMLLGGGANSTTNLEKDITLMKTYRTTKKVLDKVNSYMVRYFITDNNHKELELENNISIKITDVNINDYQKYGMRLTVKPINTTQYELTIPSLFNPEKIGVYHYSEIVRHINSKTKQEDFSLMIHKKQQFTKAITVELAGTQHYVYDKIIRKNLTIEADKESPFLIISYLDNLPHRGETYLKNLIEIYTQQSIQNIKDDNYLLINSYNSQLKKIEQRVNFSSKQLEKYKSKHGIIEPQIQATAIVQELSQVGIDISKNQYKEELIKNLIKFVKKNENIDAIAPSLMELKDQPTIELLKLIQEQQISLNELLIKYKISHPSVSKSYQFIDILQAKVLSNLKNLQKTIQSKTLSLKKMEKGYKRKLQASPKQEQKVIKLSRDYKVNEKLYLYLMQERSGAQIKHDKALGRFKIIEEIYTANNPVKPKKSLIVLVVFITSIILMLFITFIREFLKSGKEKGV